MSWWPAGAVRIALAERIPFQREVALAPTWLRRGQGWFDRLRSHPAPAALLCLLAAGTAQACLWDRDTLATERAGLPGVYEAVMGWYPRHSREFYQRRVAQVEAVTERTPELYDDLAVARERLGQTDLAVKLMRDKEQRFPGLYTTQANLGSFLAHRGDYDAGAKAIERSMQINPAAHFNREEYQLRAIRYLARLKADPGLATRENMLGVDFQGRLGEAFRLAAPRVFANDAEKAAFRSQRLADLKLKEDVFDGVIGLITIGQKDSGELFYVLGELLAAIGERRLAWHSYQRAIDLAHPRAPDLAFYQQQLLEGLDPRERDELRPAAHWRQRRRALAWVDAYQQFERDLIKQGGDPEDPAAFAPFYQEHPLP